MSKRTQYSPNMFNVREAPKLNEAFGKAWRVLTAQQADPENEPGSIGLQCRIAATIIAVASSGVIDASRMAKAAIDQCGLTPKIRLAGFCEVKAEAVGAMGERTRVTDITPRHWHATRASILN
jgi:hypothetical protein